MVPLVGSATSNFWIYESGQSLLPLRLSVHISSTYSMYPLHIRLQARMWQFQLTPQYATVPNCIFYPPGRTRIPQISNLLGMY